MQLLMLHIATRFERQAIIIRLPTLGRFVQYIIIEHDTVRKYKHNLKLLGLALVQNISVGVKPRRYYSDELFH